MNQRRLFIQKASTLTASLITAAISQPVWSKNIASNLDRADGLLPDELSSDEKFWKSVQKAFINKSGLINLNNGGVSPAPRIVADAMKENYDYSNQAPSHFMWHLLDKGREPLRKRLATIAGCSEEEIAMNRNATEGLETIIFGLPLKAGDEIVAAKQDYPHPVFAWKQREQRDGIKVNWINLELPSEDDDYLVKSFVNAFTAKTKLVHLTHIINWNGQILPINKIAAEAHKRGIEVMVDGAHSFAHFNFSINNLDVDYFATSLHKWLYAPIGAGLLYVKKEKIKKLYPLFAATKPDEDDIRKFEHLGTRPFYIEQAINKAIDFHEMIGIERKEQRLHYLKNYWMEKVKDLPNVKISTSLNKQFACAIGNFSIKEKKPMDINAQLFDNNKIHAVGIDYENISGVRITPNLYTTTKQLDLLVKAITELAK